MYEELSNDEVDKLDDNGSEVLGSDKECLDEGIKEINKEVVKTENVNKVTNVESDGSEMNDNDKNKNEKKNMQDEPDKTYANVIRKTELSDSNKLKIIPVDTNDLGEEVIVFDEELVKIRSKKWELTLCGQFVGNNMSLPMLHYYLRRMWSRYGFKEIVDNGNGKWLFKFNRMNGMMEVVNKSPWMVNNKPLIVQKWDPSIGIGKPKIMDNMTSYVCKSGMGRTEFARVLVEIEAKKGFKSEVVIQYRDKDKNRTKTDEEITEDIAVDIKNKVDEEFTLVQNRHKRPARNVNHVQERNNRYMNTNFRHEHDRSKVWQKKNQRSRKGYEGNSGEFGYDKNKKFKEEFPRLNNQKKQDEKNKNPMNDMNKFSVLGGLRDDNQQELNMLKDKILVDKHLNLKWNTDVVRLMVINESKQHMLCLIKNIHDHRKLFCSFVYALNSRTKRRDIWNELQIAKACTNVIPWILIGDFNVTFSLGLYWDAMDYVLTAAIVHAHMARLIHLGHNGSREAGIADDVCHTPKQGLDGNTCPGA
ncbi:RNA-directed DNA polymerase, eukaryota, reverse transcriptase zinc-binding domain protein [Tanacetum coccineum]